MLIRQAVAVLAALAVCLYASVKAYAFVFAAPVVVEAAAAVLSNIALRTAAGALVAEIPVGGTAAGAAGTALATVAGAGVIATAVMGNKHELPVSNTPGTQVPLTQPSVGAYAVMGFTDGSPAGACSQFVGSLRNTQVCQTSPNVYVQWTFVSATSSVCTIGYSFSSPCTPGSGQQTYGVSGTTVTETRTTPDTKKDWKRADNGWVPDTSDPDQVGQYSSVPSTGQPVAVTGRDPYGNPVSAKLAPRANGGVEATTRVQVPDATGNSKVVERTAQLDSSGTIVNQTQNTYTNTYIDNSTGDAVTVTGAPAGAPAAAPAASITFPDDYAREATVQGANSRLDEVKTKLDTLHTDLTAPDNTVVDPVPKTGDEFTAIWFPNTFGALSSWGMPSRSASCPTAAFDLWSTHYVIDSHCTLLASVSGTVSAVMLLMWAITALLIVLSA